MSIKTAYEIRSKFLRLGLTVTEWAKLHGVSRQTVTAVLSGRLKGRRGGAHRVAVLLGLKEGEV